MAIRRLQIASSDGHQKLAHRLVYCVADSKALALDKDGDTSSYSPYALMVGVIVQAIWCGSTSRYKVRTSFV